MMQISEERDNTRHSSPVLIGIDTGGTYTDFVFLKEGDIQVLKVSSTPKKPGMAALQGVKMLKPPGGFTVAHGSTVGTNAILERKGAKTALVTTKGFADVLRIGRQTRENLYSLAPDDKKPLVERSCIFEVDERVNWKGEIIRHLDPAEPDELFRKLSRKKITSVAVCFLFSFLNDRHEKILGSCKEAENYSISLSSEILCELREYERCVSTVLNAFISPIMSSYLRDLSLELESLGAESLWIMQSNGGIFSVESAVRQPVHCILSGPAAGVAGAFTVAEDAGFSNIIAFDMGGTSTDVSLCEGGALPMTREGSIERYPLRIPILDIHTVGAGGGSIASIDEGGVLKVGPESAGADPGPVCFGNGRSITVTDAHLILGRLPGDRFLGGARKTDLARTLSFMQPLAEKMGCGIEEAAWGVIRVVQTQMEGALRVVSLQRGYDPRRFTLLAFGGGGPLHACELAASLTIPKVMIPRFPGVLSALGMIMAPHFLEFSRTKKVMLDEADLPGIDSVFDSLRQKAVEEMGAREPLRYDYFLDMRYRGQAYDMTVPVKAMDLDRIKKDFISLHKRRYGYVRTEGDIEMVTFRLRAGRPPVKLSLQSGRRIRKASPAVARHQDVWWAENRSPLAVYSFPLIERDSLAPGVTLEGPALLLQYDCTTFVPPRWSGTVDRGENLILSNPDCGDREKME